MVHSAASASSPTLLIRLSSTSLLVELDDLQYYCLAFYTAELLFGLYHIN